MSTAVAIPEFHDAYVAGRYQGGGHIHERGATRGYLVVRTDWTDGVENLKREPVAFFEIEPAFRAGEARYTNAYGEALDAVHALRADCTATQYGVIDTVYDCGCRFNG